MVEAKVLNDTKHEILNYVGGRVSLEMECPKMLWLKKHLNELCWSKVGKLFDLPDFLTWKCTGDDTRSLCSVVCKWNYDGIKKHWPADFFRQVGLAEVCDNEFDKIGRKVCEPGSTVGQGLNESAAKDLGLLPGTPVSSSMIDAHAGALCLFGCHAEGIDETLNSKMAVICGTSSCHMSVENEAIWSNGKVIPIISTQRIWSDPIFSTLINRFVCHCRCVGSILWRNLSENVLARGRPKCNGHSARTRRQESSSIPRST